MQFIHKTVIHSGKVINPYDRTHTQAIELLLGKFKKHIKNTHGIVGDKLEYCSLS